MTLSRRYGHAHCLMCGQQNPRSLGLRFHRCDGGVRTTFQTQPELQGYTGWLHGGMVASLLDAAMTHCLFDRGVEAMTGDLHIRFVEPVPCEADLEIHARVLSATPPLYRLRAELAVDSELLAWAEGKFMERRGAHS